MKFSIAAYCSLIFATLLFTTQSFAAGGETSGGGGGFVCRDSAQNITEVEFLDVWEARNLLLWPIADSSLTTDEILEQTFQQVESFNIFLGTLFRMALSDIKAKIQFLPPGVAIAPPSDANPVYIKPGCPLEGILYFDGSKNKLMVNPSLYRKMNSTNEAAALLHEAIYKLARNYFEDERSDRSRQSVGCLLSSKCSVTHHPEISIPTTGPLVKCENPQYEYFYFPLTSETYRFVITKLNWKPIDAYWDLTPNELDGFHSGVGDNLNIIREGLPAELSFSDLRISSYWIGWNRGNNDETLIMGIQTLDGTQLTAVPDGNTPGTLEPKCSIIRP